MVHAPPPRKPRLSRTTTPTRSLSTRDTVATATVTLAVPALVCVLSAPLVALVVTGGLVTLAVALWTLARHGESRPGPADVRPRVGRGDEE